MLKTGSLLMALLFSTALVWSEGRDHLLQIDQPATSSPLQFMNGVNYCSYWKDDYQSEYSPRSLVKVRQAGCDWVSILVTWYQEDELTTRISPHADLTPTDAALKKAIADAKGLSLHVALKPHVDLLNGEWRGYIGRGVPDEQFDTFFSEWFESYRNYIDHIASVGEAEGAELLFTGTEYVEILNRENGKTIPAWIAYFNDLRKTFSGKLSYCADRRHWPDTASVTEKTQFVPFFQALDYIGIDAYWTLSHNENPTTRELIEGWMEPMAVITTMHATYGRDVILSELGYRSIDKCHMNPWDYMIDRPVNEEAQKRCYLAFYRAFSGKPWLSGVFWWNWIPFLEEDIRNPSSPEWLKNKLPEYEKGYTPEGKSAQSILKTHASLFGFHIY